MRSGPREIGGQPHTAAVPDHLPSRDDLQDVIADALDARKIRWNAGDVGAVADAVLALLRGAP